MVVCALIPRFELIAAAAGRREMLGRPVALAPLPGGPQVIGDASGPAEAFGVRKGMRLAEALGRCPGLALLPPDPQRALEIWEGSLTRLESMGAAVEPGRPGEAFFAAEGLRGVLGGPERVLAEARRALARPVRLGVGPTRLCALAAATRSRPGKRARRGGSRAGGAPAHPLGGASGRAARSGAIVAGAEARALLASLPIGTIRERLGNEWDGVNLADTLERLGLRTLGELAELPDAAVADRLGAPGLKALRLARGQEEPLRPRPPRVALREGIELPEAAGGAHLERALEILVDRLLARRERQRRGIRRLRLEARLAAGGGWVDEAAMRSASADRERLLLALAPKLAALPAPASRLWLSALELGEQAVEQPTLERDPSERRRGRLAEAVRQARAACGRDAVLRVLDVDAGSGVPERRATLTPFDGEEPSGGRSRGRPQR